VIDHTHYAYRVRWSPDDGEYLATVAEFPSLSWLDEDPQKALTGLMDLVAEVVSDMRANGERIPEPLSERHYSGKFQVRIPESLHRELALEAAEKGISMNRLVSDRLARARG
jgi:predicted HicB family RNase H-like nuclease